MASALPAKATSHCPSWIARTALDHRDEPAGTGRGMAEPGPFEAMANADAPTGRVGQPLFGKRSRGRRIQVGVAELFHKAPHVSHVSRHGAAETAGIERMVQQAGVGHRFVRDAITKGQNLKLVGRVQLDVDRRSDQHAIGNSDQSGQTPHGAVPLAHCAPHALAIATDRSNQPNAGDDHRVELGYVGLHVKSGETHSLTAGAVVHLARAMSAQRAWFAPLCPMGGEL